MKKYKGAVFFDYDGTLVDEVDHIKTVTPKLWRPSEGFRITAMQPCFVQGGPNGF